MEGKQDLVTIKGQDSIRINGFDAKTQEEFYRQMKRFVRILPEDDYNDALEEKGFWGGGVASAHAYFDRKTDPNGSVIFSEINAILIVINQDKYKGTENTLMQAAIRHELAELWVYGKMGFSLLTPMKKADIFESEKIADLAHHYARQEEFKYAIEHGFGEQELAFIKQIVDPKEAFQSEQIYRKVAARKLKSKK